MLHLPNENGKNKISRVANIEKLANQKEKEKVNAEELKLKRIENYKEKIRALKPRIDELIEVGNSCLDNNIPLIKSDSTGFKESYENHQFISNSWSHLVGFIQGKPITKVGKIGGGACDWNLTTDGVTIEVSGNVEYVLKNFLDNFDTFETKFYEYVDKITEEVDNSENMENRTNGLHAFDAVLLAKSGNKYSILVIARTEKAARNRLSALDDISKVISVKKYPEEQSKKIVANEKYAGIYKQYRKKLN